MLCINWYFFVPKSVVLWGANLDPDRWAKCVRKHSIAVPRATRSTRKRASSSYTFSASICGTWARWLWGRVNSSHSGFFLKAHPAIHVAVLRLTRIQLAITTEPGLDLVGGLGFWGVRVLCSRTCSWKINCQQESSNKLKKRISVTDRSGFLWRFHIKH